MRDITLAGQNANDERLWNTSSVIMYKNNGVGGIIMALSKIGCPARG